MSLGRSSATEVFFQLLLLRLKQELDLESQAKKRKADDEDMHGVSEPVNTVDGDSK